MIIGDMTLPVSDPTSRLRLPLRERRRAATHAEIARAAVELFERQGYENTTVEQIAERAGVSMRTYYRYCAGKDEALTSSLTTPGPKVLTACIGARADLPFQDAIVQGFVEAASAGSESLDELRRVLRLILGTPSLRTAWLATVREARDDLVQVIAARRPALTDFESRALTAALSGALTVAFESWALSPDANLADEGYAAVRVLGPILQD